MYKYFIVMMCVNAPGLLWVYAFIHMKHTYQSVLSLLKNKKIIRFNLLEEVLKNKLTLRLFKNVSSLNQSVHYKQTRLHQWHVHQHATTRMPVSPLNLHTPTHTATFKFQTQCMLCNPCADHAVCPVHARPRPPANPVSPSHQEFHSIKSQISPRICNEPHNSAVG